jgi:hypothetical protein
LKDISSLMLSQIKVNYDASRASVSRKGQVIYNILQTVFSSAKDSSINLTTQLGIPAIYSVDYKSLVNDSGKIIQQVFFYGDKDGQGAFGYYLNRFNPAEWKIDQSNKEWVVIKSIKGKPIWIYANRPLDYLQDLDSLAQEHLISYLRQNDLEPTIVIHRGHSYWVNSTIRHLPSSARVVILGSCGGYHNLDEVLKRSPDAHIISSKQVGSGTVNNPIIFAVNNQLRNGKNVEWIPIWRDLEKLMSGNRESKDLFDDYVPPHKNLGAIFIKAYKKAMGEE